MKKRKIENKIEWKKIILLFVLTFSFGALSVLVYSSKPFQEFISNRNVNHDILIKAPFAEIYAEVADTDSKKETGLSYRKKISDDEGMIFVFDKVGIYPFWMKDMNFPIDILWLDEDYRVVYMEENLATSSYPNAYANKAGAKYVLEINANKSKDAGIYLGTKLVIGQK